MTFIMWCRYCRKFYHHDTVNFIFFRCSLESMHYHRHLYNFNGQKDTDDAT